ncbi:MAG: protein-L-isoaspartate O-methyltransferase [Bacteroidetes bacterium RIFCSPLOWO2_12_FULL_37_12]|nr:MAG: protein-L-isoaspartate O-methyltransferase [Bacteroidetes bacterium RIFCSPLOWO2_12_FULL_37_12]
MLLDSYRHKGMRKALCQEIRDKGFSNEKILKAIDKVPRHFFLDSSFTEHAYEDKPFPIGEDQTISQPYTVAVQTELLDVQKNDKILEIGTGSGYQACILVELGAKVFSIELNRILYEKTKQLLAKMNYYPKLFLGDGSLGLPSFAPYDKIIVTAAAPKIPDGLMNQLKIGGRLIIPVGKGEVQKMICVIKQDNELTESSEYGSFKFVPLLGKNGKPL